MSDEQNPTPTGGDSTQERIQRFLAAEDTPAPKATAPEPSQADATTPEPAQAAEKPVEPDRDGEQQDEGPQITTADVAKYLGIDADSVDVDEDGTIKVKTKIDGTEGTAKLQDLLRSYQLQGHIDNKARAVAEAHKAAEARMQEVHQFAQQRLQQADALAQTAAQELLKEYQSVDWNTLRVTDPGQWAALQQDYKRRESQINQVFATVDQAKAQEQQRSQQAIQQLTAQEAAKLVELVPAWKDPQVFHKESTAVRTWAIQSGMPAEVVEAVSNGPMVSAHLVAALHKAMLFDQLQAKKPEIENRVRTAPKIVKPGQAQQDGPSQQLKNIRQSISKSGGRQGVAAYLMATGRA